VSALSATKQGTKKLTEITVLGESKMSSLARLDHSCARNEQLKMVNVALRAITEGMLGLTRPLSWLKALTYPD
jgi:hypothetical protein